MFTNFEIFLGNTEHERGEKHLKISFFFESVLPRPFELLLYNIQTSHLSKCPQMKVMQLSFWLLLLSVLTPAQQ